MPQIFILIFISFDSVHRKVDYFLPTDGGQRHLVLDESTFDISRGRFLQHRHDMWGPG